MLIRNHQLSSQQLNDLDTLCADCKYTDGNSIAIYRHLLSQPRSLDGNLLYYQKEHLIAYLSAFFFYEHSCEISLMVAPTSRRCGIATQLIQDIFPIIKEQAIKTLIFSMPHGLNNEWLPALGFTYLNSEYQMLRQQNERPAIANNSLHVRAATIADIQALCTIDNSCFPMQQPDITIRFYQLLHDPQYTLYIAEKDGAPIGKAHVHMQQKNARFTDIAILPDVQRQGFGSTLLAHCINDCLATNQPTITLDVETNNQQALKLYTRLGFVINNAYDFWSIPAKVIRNAQIKQSGTP